jgi:tRNA (cytosine40_48-C5)-methyltransferase
MNLLHRYKNFGQEFEPEDIIIRPALRINTLKTCEEEVVSWLNKRGVVLEKIPFIPFAYWYESPIPLASTPEYLGGYIYIQETASQLPVHVLLAGESLNGKLILDMCSAPGSKTTQLAMQAPLATIIAIDNSAPRLQSLTYNLERYGISNVVVYKKDAKYVRDLGFLFDYILLDAPCSGNFCLEKDFFSKRTLADVKTRPKEQLSLLQEARSVLANKGVLVYSTCSLEPEENELCIQSFLDHSEDMVLEEIHLPIGDEGYTSILGKNLDESVSKTKRFWPHKTGTQGFFIAKFRKISQE